MYVSYVKQNERNAYDRNLPQNRYFSPKKEMDSIYFKFIYFCIVVNINDDKKLTKRNYNNNVLQKSALAGSPSHVAIVEPTLAISSDVPPGI